MVPELASVAYPQFSISSFSTPPAGPEYVTCSSRQASFTASGALLSTMYQRHASVLRAPAGCQTAMEKEVGPAPNDMLGKMVEGSPPFSMEPTPPSRLSRFS